DSIAPKKAARPNCATGKRRAVCLTWIKKSPTREAGGWSGPGCITHDTPANEGVQPPGALPACNPACSRRMSHSSRLVPMFWTMPKPIDLPPQVAKAFVRDVRVFFKAKDQLKRDEIAALAGWAQKEHLPKGIKLRITDVKELLLQMRDPA